MLKVTPRLDELRKAAGMTQVELAEKAGIPQAAISRFDRASQGSYANIIAIARALNVPVEALFHIEETDESAPE
ncbi:helix-turn-helix domain-containing protein [Paenibacillus sp. UASWS1643]|uniref:helix-turn-helix domain-containing protein n=1 Tax=Paenibacillus sp. UASWS1643 TaxID=2580422 RepID=UPI00123990C6|nr:helix-turn-helix transcriptional regulator [Paenibacillus sp. UASWS1643]KAA8750156.1 helix-turn-helix transcriptional regulator [Paenibacillus sp. UASWS1643]